MHSRQLWLLTLLCTTALGQELTPPPPPAPPPPAAPAPRAPREGARLVGPDDVRTGIQFHGDVGGSNAGMFGAVSFGIGFNRVAILFTPQLATSSPQFAVDLSVRIYLHNRQAGLLVGVLRPNAGLGIGNNTLFAGGGLGAGVEYLLTKNLGFTAELGLRVTGIVGAAPLTLLTVGTVGVMLHQ